MTTHQFTPDRYYHMMGAFPAALTIQPGDIVETTSIDAGGVDKDLRQVYDRRAPNPMTGPFYVEGAEQGDTLVVHLDKIYPNRRMGWGSARLAPNVVDPEYVVHLPYDEEFKRPRAEWDVDMAGGFATLVTPKTLLGHRVSTVLPMIGCLGVAPEWGESISTATSGPFGGNMDYNGIVEGITLYFPVFQPGALFFLGDVHALQGDGEMTGTGIEISADLTFTVDLQKGRTIGWPRGENETHIFTAGNARPLDQAVQHATTEMVRWLQEEYKLDALGANILLGYAVEYQLGNMFDPAYTMICKIRKSLLPKV